MPRNKYRTLTTLPPASQFGRGDSIIYQGEVLTSDGVNWTSQTGPLSYTAATLPDPATLGVGAPVVVNDEPLASNGQFFGRYIKKPALVKSDGVLLYDAVITFGANAVIASTSGAFTQSDVGKRVAFYEKVSGAAARAGCGNIVAVTSSTTVVTDMTVSGASNVLVAAVAYGTDMGAYINDYWQSIKRHGGCDVGNFVYLSSVKLLLPNGVTLEGNGRKGGFDLPHNANLQGANVFVCATTSLQSADNSFFDIGDGGEAGFEYLSGGGTKLIGINVDGFLLPWTVTKGVAAACKMTNAQSLRNYSSAGYAIRAVGGMTIDDCVGVSHYRGTPIGADSVGDVHIRNGGAFGAGNGYFALKISNCSDVDVTGIHLWKCSNDATMLGGQVLIEGYGGSKLKNNRIENCTFDTSFGPHVKLALGSGCSAYNVAIVGNQGFNNNAVPAATYPCMEVAAPSSGAGYIRAMTVTGNGFDSSFDDESKGTYTGFIQQTGAGTVGLRAVTVGINAANNCAAGYLGGFTPNYSAGNVAVPIGSSTTTTF